MCLIVLLLSLIHIFSIADEIALSLGFDGDDPCRLRAALTYEVDHNAANGHVFLPREKLHFATSQLLAVTPDELELALDVCRSMP